MPRFTRDQRFRKAFDVYMYDFVSSTDLVDLRQWKLNRISENQTSCEHIYGLSISSDYIMYTVDAHTPIGSDAIMYTVDAHTPIGSDAMQVSEDVYGTQQLPSLRELKAHFTAYFKPYDLVIGDTIMSYIELLDMDDQGDEINAIVRVIYHKKHMPYPVPPCTEIEELRQESDFRGAYRPFEKQHRAHDGSLSNETAFVGQVVAQIVKGGWRERRDADSNREEGFGARANEENYPGILFRSGGVPCVLRVHLLREVDHSGLLPLHLR